MKIPCMKTVRLTQSINRRTKKKIQKNTKNEEKK